MRQAMAVFYALQVLSALILIGHVTSYEDGATSTLQAGQKEANDAASAEPQVQPDSGFILLNSPTGRDVSDDGASPKPTILDSFRRRPTRSQHLLLVPRDSPHKILLDEGTTYRLLHNQQLHNQHTHNLDADISPKGPFEIAAQEAEVIASAELLDLAMEKSLRNQSELLASGAAESPPKKPETVPLLLKSHPGQAIVPLSENPKEGGFMMLGRENIIDLGVGAPEHALHIKVVPMTSFQDEPRYELETVSLQRITTTAKPSIAVPVVLSAKSPSNELDPLNHVIASILQQEDSIVIHNDGSLSPLSARHLFIGISPYPAISLVPHDSSKKLFFTQTNRFWSPAYDHLSLNVDFFPGLAIIMTSPIEVSPMLTIRELLLGPAERAVQFFPKDFKRHHHYHISSGSFLLVPHNLRLEPDNSLVLMGWNTTTTKWSMLLRESMEHTNNRTWIVNRDGTISPLFAPHLAIGCEALPLVPPLKNTQRRTAEEEENEDTSGIYLSPPTDSLGPVIIEALEVWHTLAVFLYEYNCFRHLALIFLAMLVVAVKLIPLAVWIAVLLRFLVSQQIAVGFICFHLGIVTSCQIMKWMRGR